MVYEKVPKMAGKRIMYVARRKRLHAGCRRRNGGSRHLPDTTGKPAQSREVTVISTNLSRGNGTGTGDSRVLLRNSTTASVLEPVLNSVRPYELTFDVEYKKQIEAFLKAK